MARYRGPKNRIARKFGVNIFGRARNPLIHKPNPPGVHGARRRKKSDYGQQLEEKQKLKAVYGMISEKQLVRYYKKASRKGSATKNLLVLLECRLDVILYRLKLAPTIFASQQLVAHGHVTVNGRKVDCRSFQVAPGMKVSIKEKSIKMVLVQNSLQNSSRDVPEYLSIDPKKSEGELLNYPELDQVSHPLTINLPVVCDFLAHTT